MLFTISHIPYTLYRVRRTLYSVLCTLYCFSLTGCSRPAPVEVYVDAKCAVIMEAKSGKALYEKNPDAKFPPASTAKVMTAIVALENLSLDSKIKPDKKVILIQPTRAGLKSGVEYSLRDLLSAILIKSANDAAYTIAVAISGSEKEFAVLMNRKAEELGMKNTYFATASGLPTGKRDSQYTTARDLSILMRYAARRKVVLEIMSKKELDIYGSDGKRIHLKTHNTSLFKSSDAPWGKTGYTRQAKRTFTGTDGSLEPKIVFALLQSDKLWNDVTALKNAGLKAYEERYGTPKARFKTWVREHFPWVKI